MKKRFLITMLVIAMVVAVIPAIALTAQATTDEFDGEWDTVPTGVASVTTTGGTTTSYTALEDAFAAAAAAESSELKLLTTIERNEYINITSGKFTLNLNGQTWTSSNHVLWISGTADVKITDTAGGALKGAADGYATIQLDGSAKLEITGGTVEHTNGSNAITMWEGGLKTSSDLTVSGGTVKANSSNLSIAISAYGNAVTVTGGTVEGARLDIEYANGIIDLSGHPDPTGITVANFTGSSVTVGSESFKIPDGYAMLDSIGNVQTTLANYETYEVGKVAVTPEVKWGASADASLIEGTLVDAKVNNAAYIQLQKDITWDGTLAFVNSVTIDLNGKTLTVTGDDFGIYLPEGNLTVTDSSAAGNGCLSAAAINDYSYGVLAIGSITVTGGSLSGISSGTTGVGVYVDNDIIVEDGNLSGEATGEIGCGIFSVGDIMVSGGSLSGTSSGADGGGVSTHDSITVTGGSLSGTSSGTNGIGVNVDNGIIVEGGNFSGEATGENGFGIVSLSDIMVSGGSLSGIAESANGLGIDAYATVTVKNDGKITATGMPDAIYVSNEIDSGYTVESETTDAATGLTTAVLVKKAAATANVASVTVGGNTTNYTELEEAFEAAASASGSTLTLLDNILRDTEIIVKSGNFTVDLNGKTWECTDDIIISLRNDAKLKIDDGSTDKSGKILASDVASSAINMRGNAELEIAGGTFESASYYVVDMSFAGNITSAKLVVSGGRLITNGNIVIGAFGSLITVTGGTLEHNGSYAAVHIYYRAGAVDLSDHPDPSGIVILNGHNSGDVILGEDTVKIPDGYDMLDNNGNAQTTLLSGHLYEVGKEQPKTNAFFTGFDFNSDSAGYDPETGIFTVTEETPLVLTVTGYDLDKIDTTNYVSSPVINLRFPLDRYVDIFAYAQPTTVSESEMIITLTVDVIKRIAAEDGVIDAIVFSNDGININGYIELNVQLVPHSITVTPSENGAVTVSSKAGFGSTVEISVIPEEGYTVDTLTVTGAGGEVTVTREGIHVYTFRMLDSDVSVSATFRKAERYTVTLEGGVENATVTVAEDAFEGSYVTVTVLTDFGYIVESITVSYGDNASLEAEKSPDSDTEYRFIMPSSDVTVKVKTAKGAVISDMYVPEGTPGYDPETGEFVMTPVNPFIIVIEGINFNLIPYKWQLRIGGTASGESLVGYISSIASNVTDTELTIIVDVAMLNDAKLIHMVDGTLVGKVENYFDNQVISDVKLYYSYVTVEPSENGRISLPHGLNPGETAVITVDPDKGYGLETLTVTDASGNPVEVVDGSFTVPEGGATVKATFSPKAEYTVTVNGEATEEETVDIKDGDVIGLEVVGAKEDDVIEVVFEAVKDGESVAVANGNSYTVKAADFAESDHLYVYVYLNGDEDYVRAFRFGYTVSFAAGKGSGEMASVNAYGEFELPASGFTPPVCHVFAGWAVTESGETVGETYKLTGDTVFYAVYAESTHTDVEGNDHACDLCGKELTECTDGDNDHKCDVCTKVLGECADTDKNGKCDVCDVDMPTEPGVTTPGTDDPIGTTDVPGTDTSGTDVPDTDEPDTDPIPDGQPKSESDDSGCGCGGFSVIPIFIAMICAAGAVFVAKKK